MAKLSWFQSFKNRSFTRVLNIVSQLRFVGAKALPKFIPKKSAFLLVLIWCNLGADSKSVESLCKTCFYSQGDLDDPSGKPLQEISTQPLWLEKGVVGFKQVGQTLNQTGHTVARAYAGEDGSVRFQQEASKACEQQLLFRHPESPQNWSVTVQQTRLGYFHYQSQKDTALAARVETLRRVFEERVKEGNFDKVNRVIQDLEALGSYRNELGDSYWYVYHQARKALRPNNPPEAQEAEVETTRNQATKCNLKFLDSDSNSFDLKVMIHRLPGHGTLFGRPPFLVYKPTNGFHGDDFFSFRVTDGFGESNIAIVSITVSENEPPQVQSSQKQAFTGETLEVVLTGLDPNGDSLTFHVVEPPKHGRLEGRPPKLLYFSDEQATDAFTFVAYDGRSTSQSATITIVNGSARKEKRTPTDGEPEQLEDFEDLFTDEGSYRQEEIPKSESVFLGQKTRANKYYINRGPTPHPANYHGIEISLTTINNYSVAQILEWLADQVGITIWVHPDIPDTRRSYNFRNMAWDHALDVILEDAHLAKDFQYGVLSVFPNSRRYNYRRKVARLLRLKWGISAGSPGPPASTEGIRGNKFEKFHIKNIPGDVVLGYLADRVGFNVAIHPAVAKDEISLQFRNIPWDQVFHILLRRLDAYSEFRNGVMHITPIDILIGLAAKDEEQLFWAPP